MTSELKSATARANGAKSRGPKSPETRAKSSLNALQHGFTTRKTIVLECECEDDFQELLAEYAATYQPDGPVEKDLVLEMVAARWRIQRLRMIEAAPSTVKWTASCPSANPDPPTPATRSPSPSARLVDDSHALSFASRYESRLHRIHERSYRTLRELQQSRKQQTAESSSASPAPPEPPSRAAAEPAPEPESQLPLQHPGKKCENEPTPGPRADASKHVQSLVLLGHRGITRYLNSNPSRRFGQIKTV